MTQFDSARLLALKRQLIAERRTAASAYDPPLNLQTWPYTGTACKQLDIHANTLRDWGARGLIRHFRTPSGRYRWDVEGALAAGLRGR